MAGDGSKTLKDSPDPLEAAFDLPATVRLYPPNSILVAGYNEHRVRLIRHNGSVTTLAGGGSIDVGGLNVDSDDPLAARFWRPQGLCPDDEGNVLLCDSYNHRIRTILRNGSVRTLAGSGGTGQTNGGYRDNADPLQAIFFLPSGITSTLESGQRLVIIGGNCDHRIRAIYANKTVATLAGSGSVGTQCTFGDSANPLSARFCHPIGVVVDPFGNIIIGDQGCNRVRKLWRYGSVMGVTTVAGKGPCSTPETVLDSDNPSQASFASPSWLTLDSVGNILVSAAAEHRVRIVLVNGSVRTLAAGGSSLLANASSGFVDDVPLLQARFYLPQDLQVDRLGNVLLADYGNCRIRMLCAAVGVASFSISQSNIHNTLSKGATSRTPATVSNSTSTAASQSQAESLTGSPSHARSLSRSHRIHQPSNALSSTPIAHLFASEDLARAVVASGAATAALAGFAATSTMGHATRMGALMRSVECAFAGEPQPPSLVELPVQWNIEPQSGSVGAHAGSAVLTSAVLVVLPLLVCAVVHHTLAACGVAERRVLRSLQVKIVSQYCLLSMAFFTPNVLMSTVVVVGRNRNRRNGCGCSDRSRRATAPRLRGRAACCCDGC